MPARTAPIIIPKGRGAGDRLVETDRRNFEINNDPNGAAKAKAAMEQAAQAAQARTGPTMTLDGDALAAQRQSRAQADAYAEALRAQALGYGYNPAQQQLQQQTAAAQGQQRSIAASQMGYGMAGARRAASAQGAALDAQAAQQSAILGAQQQAFGREQYGAFAEAMRGQDLAARGAFQDNAIKQAQLSDEQRSRNDAMAQFYLNEQGRVRRGQSQADQNFERQDAANKFGVSNLNAGIRAYDQTQDDRAAAMALAAGGATVTAASKYATSPDDAQTKKKNPYDPGDY